jgi:hypothetical protein
MQMIIAWWRFHRRPVLFGLATGLLWGGLTAATVAPHDWLVYDMAGGLVYGYSASGALVRALRAEVFFREYQAVLIQATLLLLIVVGLAGWATWQHTQVRPRGQAQPDLRAGSDWFVIALALGGLCAVWVFWRGHAAEWFKGSPAPFPAVAVALLSIVLPLYMGVGLFLVWFRRLPSSRPPDWETRFARRPAQPGKARWRPWRRRGQGGDAPHS